MAEVYDLSMKIGVTGNVLATLSQISSDLTRIAGQQDLVNAKFAAALESVGKIGVAIAGAGLSILFGLNKVASVWDEILDKQKRVLASGISIGEAQADSVFALERARVQHIDPNAAAATMNLLTQLYGSEEAKRLLPRVIENQEALRTLHDSADTEAFLRMMKSQNIPESGITERMDFLTRFVAAGGGSGQDFISAYGMGPALKDMTYGSREALITLMQAMPKEGRSNVGMLMQQEFGDVLGDPNSKKYQKIQGLLPAGTNLADYQNDWYGLSQKIAEGLNLRSVPKDQQNNVIMNALKQAGFNERVAGMMQYPMEQGQYMLGAASPFGRPNQTQSAEEINKITDIAQAETRAINEMNIAFAELGSKGLTDEVLKRWKQLDDVLTEFADWTKTLDPDMVRAATKALIGAGGALLLLGGIMTGVAIAAMIGSGGTLLLLVAGLGALAGVDYKGIIEMFDALEESIKSWGQRLREFANPAASPQPTIGPHWEQHPGGRPRWVQGSSDAPSPTPMPPLPGDTAWLGARPLLPRDLPAMAGGEPFGKFAMGAVQPGSGQSKTVTAVTNFNISGRLLASAVQYYMMQENELATGAAAANGAAWPVSPGAGQSDN